ncbi:MAG: LysR family transcriptional regulator, partial [Chloroflexi bacterium]|nr:LysR family transcriptional regulator [Chloroflexota bacterium]
MELRQLTTFLTVASTLNFTHAADALDYAQSSVTAQIQALEEELGVPLFERLGRRVTLSTAGQRLLPYAKEMLRLAEEMRGAVPDDQEPSGILNIGAPESLCAYRLPPVLLRFRTLFPKVQLVFNPDNGPALSQILSEGRLDMGFLLEAPTQSAHLIAEPLSHEPLLLLTYPSHPLAQAPVV